jgi:lysophospholipid acyltransferase (LPLAT)-like uncharacterized protein
MNAMAETRKRLPARLFIISRLLALYLQLVYVTSRWHIENREVFDTLLKQQGGRIMTFWHGRMCAMPRVFRPFGTGHVLISAHKDGELIARVMEAMGYDAVRGSTARQRPGEALVDKGGAAALRSLVRLLKSGGHIGITPDGPRGPRMRISPGTMLLAALSGAPIVPVTYSASFAIRFKSWDRFLLPLPFGRLHVAIGTPLTVPRDADEATLSSLRLTLEAELNRLTRECDERAGQAPVAPAAAIQTGGEATVTSAS